MADDESPQTRLEQVLRQRHWTVREFLKRYQDAAGEELSERQAYRWIAGNLRKLPYPHAQAALERLFGEPVTRLLGPPFGLGSVVRAKRYDNVTPLRGSARTDWEGQVIAMCADRARDFLARAESSNVGPETIDQLVDDVRRLVTVYQQQPLETILADMADTQDRAFTLLEGRQRPNQTRDLYLLAGVTSGLIAKASHDLGASHDALTQARAAYACADNAGHDGLRAWTRGLQALITYWAGRFNDSVRYAELGAEAADRSRGTATVWLASGKARALAALNRMDEARAAIDQATAARDLVQLDELDDLGGFALSTVPVSSTTRRTPWPGVANRKPARRNASQPKHWTPTLWPLLTNEHSAMRPEPDVISLLRASFAAKSTAPPMLWRPCCNFPRRNASTGS